MDAEKLVTPLSLRLVHSTQSQTVLIHTLKQEAQSMKVSQFSIKTISFISDTMLACGSANKEGFAHNRCEVYKINQKKWESIASYSLVQGQEAFLIFQGYGPRFGPFFKP